MDDITLVGDICTVEADVNTINNHDADTGLEVNISKCEIIAEYTAAIPDSSLLSEFVKVTKDIIRTTGYYEHACPCYPWAPSRAKM